MTTINQPPATTTHQPPQHDLDNYDTTTGSNDHDNISDNVTTSHKHNNKEQ
jgi:hypothetical protein